jgi:hypothetical protein
MKSAHCAAVLAFLLGASWSAEVRADCQDPSRVCTDDSAATWSADASMTRKQRAREHAKNRKKKKVSLTVVVEGGRGSVFIDGRYFAAGEAVEIVPGKHDVHVRDGQVVLAQGVLTVPRASEGLTVTVVHP